MLPLFLPFFIFMLIREKKSLKDERKRAYQINIWGTGNRRDKLARVYRTGGGQAEGRSS